MKQFILYITLSLSYIGLSQNEEDALRYSQSFISGTARNIAMGGAMSAIGGDFSATSQNPASMAQFNKNNFSFTPVIEYTKSRSDFYGHVNSYQSAKLKVGNVSYLKSYQLPQDGTNKWTTLQLGIGLTRINSFAKQTRYRGEIDSSIIHNFINEANGTGPNFIFDKFPFGSALAYDTYAIDPDTNNFYTTELTGNSTHDRIIKEDGGMNEISLAISGNYQNKFYLGGTINITRVNYSSSYKHRETFTNQDSIWLNNLVYSGNLTTEGWGANAKIGAIYLPTSKLRFGLAIHTPTFFKLNDKWDNDMTVNTDDPDFPDKFIKDEFKPKGEFDYKLATPFKANLSTGIIIDKKASIGAEIEYIDYTLAKLSSRQFSDAPYSFNSENAQIKNLYQSKLNFKLGGEYRLNSMFYLRGGFAYYSSPYTQQSEVPTKGISIVTTGFGINLGDFYFDLALANKINQYNYYAYNPDLKGSTVSFRDNTTNVSFSIGHRFK